MDGPAFGGVDRPAIVDRLTEQIEHTAECFLADGNGERCAGVDAIHAAAQAVGGPEGDGADLAAAEVLLHFTDEFDDHAVDVGVDADGVVDGG